MSRTQPPHHLQSGHTNLYRRSGQSEGIDANEFRGIYLEWESNHERDIIAYIIYRAQYIELNDSIGDFNLLAELKTESYPITGYVDHQSMPNVGYYYKIKCENASGILSDYSDHIYYCNLIAIRTDTLFPNGRTIILPPDRSLTWYYTTRLDMENYCVTVTTESDSLIVRQLFQPQNFVGAWESWQLPDHIDLREGKVYKWRIDVGAKYIDDRETSGAESSWARFLFQQY